MRDKDLVKLLQKNGFKLDRISGSHHILTKEGVPPESIPVHGKDVPTGLLNKILKRNGLK